MEEELGRAVGRTATRAEGVAGKRGRDLDLTFAKGAGELPAPFYRAAAPRLDVVAIRTQFRPACFAAYRAASAAFTRSSRLLPFSGKVAVPALTVTGRATPGN